MTEQQKHLTNLLQQKQSLFNDIDSIQSQLNIKKELFLKVQGAIEYLQQVGVTLSNTEESEDNLEDRETENN